MGFVWGICVWIPCLNEIIIIIIIFSGFIVEAWSPLQGLLG
jgi:hypothetical protein